MANENITYRHFKYRIYPTRTQSAALDYQLSEACRLYNAGVQEHRDAWRLNRISINYYTQAMQLKEIRDNGDLGLTNFAVAQDVLRRVEKAFQRFFGRIKLGEKPGHPRFKSFRRYDSLTFPFHGNGCRLQDDGKLRVQGIGLIKVKLHRPVEGMIKTITIKRECGKWYICLALACEDIALPGLPSMVGVDVGLTTFAVLSDGTEIGSPHWKRDSYAKLRHAQRKMCRRAKGSNRRRKAVQIVQRIHAHIANQRMDFHHKLSRRIVNEYGLIAVEKLDFKKMVSGFMAGPVHDVGWGQFLNMIAYKAESAGREFVQVNPSGTSRLCSGCGARALKDLHQRVHSCPCGLILGRDHNSAINILALGLSVLGLTCDASQCVPREAVAVYS